MKEKPILFNTEMVKAILEGRKTQTRRVIKFPDDWEPLGYLGKEDGFHHSWNFSTPCGTYPGQIRRLWSENETLYVRETFCKQLGGYVYRADGEDVKFSTFKWKPSIFMPRAASRIQLLIKDIRVERVQDITTENILKEGIVLHENGWDDDWESQVKLTQDWITLWDSINEKRGYGWKVNPYVWVVEFELLTTKGTS